MRRHIVPELLFFSDIFLNAVTDEQKAIRVHDFNRRISKNIKDVCESLGIQSVTPQYARNSFISALAHHGVMTAYIDYAVGPRHIGSVGASCRLYLQCDPGYNAGFQRENLYRTADIMNYPSIFLYPRS